MFDDLPAASGEVQPDRELIAELIAMGFTEADAIREAWLIANAHLGADCILLDETGQRIAWPTLADPDDDH